MNELQWERFENLVTNPYTWAFFIFAMSLPYFLRYIRRFYPEKLQEDMKKEEACTLEYQRKPEIKLIRKIVLFGFLSSLLISYLIVYYLLDNIENKFKLWLDIFLGLSVMIMIISGVLEHRVKKDKNCNDVIVGYKFMKIVGIMEILFVVIMGILYLLGYIE